MDRRFAVGIDLGTSTSEICVYRNGEPFVIPDPHTKSPVIPSVAAIDETGAPVVGERALELMWEPGRGVREVKRLMGEETKVTLGGVAYHPSQISSLILRKLKENAELTLGEKVTQVVLTVPASFPESARQATLDAGDFAGLQILRLINEPTAAALAYGITRMDAEEQLVVFDFGGGTLDISVLEMMSGVLDVRCSYGDTQLGGKDMDEALRDLILRKFRSVAGDAVVSERAFARLKAIAERVKKELSNQYVAYAHIPGFASQGGRYVDLDVEVTRQEFERAISPILDRARTCLRRALAAKEVRPSSIDRVLLVGGSTYVPAVRQMVAEMFGREPSTDVDPDLAVSMGAAIQAAIAAGLISGDDGLIIADVAPFGLGINLVKSVGDQFVLAYEPLIMPNTTIPYSTVKTYSLLTPDQHSMEVRLYQDMTGNAKLPEDAVYTGIHAEITNIPPSQTGLPHSVEITFSYDVSGVADLTATLPATQQSVEIRYHHSPKRLSLEEKAAATSQVDELWRRSQEAHRYEALIAKAERLRQGLPDSERIELESALKALKEALVSQDAARIEAAGNALVDLMFDMG